MKNVYIFQPAIQHYRLPVWDAIAQRGSGMYEITAIGPLEKGEAFGGGARPYLRAMEETRSAIRGFVKWPQAVGIVHRDRPDVVIAAFNPRNLTCWKLPGACHQVGAACIAHSKVHSFSGIPDFIMNSVKRRFYGRADYIICYGKQSKQELLALGLSESKLRVAQNTIDTRRIFEHYDQIKARGDELRAAAGLVGRKILVCIGRMEPEKRHADLLAAWPRLREIEPNLVLVLVSGGPLLEDIRAGAKSIDPGGEEGGRIIITGRVPEGDDYAWLASADYAIFPGAVGLAINQALALGKATVIADEIGSDAEIVEHNVTGWRYPRGDIDALVKTVRRVIEDASARKRITANAGALMREHVTIDNMADVFHLTILEALSLAKSTIRFETTDEPG